MPGLDHLAMADAHPATTFRADLSKQVHDLGASAEISVATEAAEKKHDVLNMIEFREQAPKKKKRWDKLGNHGLFTL